MIILLRKTTPKGSHFYYTLHDRQSGLFELYTLTTMWGSTPEGGREKVYSFSSPEELDEKLRELITRRLRSGYSVLYSYSRDKNYRGVLQENLEDSRHRHEHRRPAK
jgi:predicted DNA-binding WGR domain protein